MLFLFSFFFPVTSLFFMIWGPILLPFSVLIRHLFVVLLLVILIVPYIYHLCVHTAFDVRSMMLLFSLVFFFYLHMFIFISCILSFQRHICLLVAVFLFLFLHYLKIKNQNYSLSILNSILCNFYCLQANSYGLYCCHPMVLCSYCMLWR